MMSTRPTTEERLRAIEDRLALAQLPSRYAMAVDSRDLDELATLFVDDVDFGPHGRGASGVKSYFDEALSGFRRSIHLLAGQTLDVLEGDTATGRVYCQAEHETGENWVVAAICYSDHYRRCGSEWRFVKRKPQMWYATDWNCRPAGPEWFNWPGKSGGKNNSARLPQSFPKWDEFWTRHGG